MSKAGQFIGVLFASRNVAHKSHLTAKVYARHMALGGFYESIVGLADRFAETYAGKFGIIEDIDLSANDDGEAIEVLRKHLNWIETNRNLIVSGTYSPLQNIIDEICGEYLQTLYKLENLI